MGTLSDGRLVPLFEEWGTVRFRQQLPAVYRLNGAVYVTSRQVLLDESKVLGTDTRAVVMDADESLDIDTLSDFAAGEAMMRQMNRE